LSSAVPLDAAFYARPAKTVARALLGSLLVSTIGDELTIGRIVETEAYVGPHDPASHAAERIGRTARNATMFGPSGIAYVYRSYGIHWCLNVVTDAPDFPAAVLIRAIEPIAGIETMRHRRWPGRPPGPDTQIGCGPGRLTVALGINLAQDGHPLDREPLLIATGDLVRRGRFVSGPRIGITRATDWPLRFYVKGNPHVSR
jgi:DNA-3-methyladenine glycosylase